MKARYEFKNDEEYQEYLKTYFSIMAMQGIIMNKNYSLPQEAAADGCRYADALIAELNKQ